MNCKYNELKCMCVYIYLYYNSRNPSVCMYVCLVVMYVCRYVCLLANSSETTGRICFIFGGEMHLISGLHINYISSKSIEYFLCNCPIFIIFWLKIQIVMRISTSAGAKADGSTTLYNFYISVLFPVVHFNVPWMEQENNPLSSKLFYWSLSKKISFSSQLILWRFH